MNESFVEILIIIPSALYTGYLLFIAGVIQNVMNQMDQASFQNFLNLLDKTAMKSPYAIIVGSLTYLGMFPYFIIYGFGNWWFTAGILVFIIASIISKSLNLPIYKRVHSLANSNLALLSVERKKLQSANRIRALIQSVSISLMTIGLIKGL